MLVLRPRPGRPLRLEVMLDAKWNWVGKLMSIEWCIVYHRWLPMVGHHLSCWIARAHHERKYGPMEDG
jgi:hypothetical protein